MKSICHTFESFGTKQVKLIEPIFQSFYKDIVPQNFIATPYPFKSDGLFNF